MEKWIVGNWKMNGSLEMAGRFVPELLGGLPEGLPGKNIRIVLCPPLPYLVVVGKKISGSGVELGAQREPTRAIRDVLFHRRFPVDARHNAKIGRERLARWAERKLR